MDERANAKPAPDGRQTAPERGEGRNATKRDALRLVTALVLLVLGALLPWLAERTPDVTERVYDPFVFRPIAKLFALVGDAVPFSIAQFWVLAFVILLGFLIVRSVRRVRRDGRSAWFSVLGTWVSLAAVIVWSFHIVWGLEYARTPFRERTGLPEVEVTTDRLTHLTRILAAETNHAHQMAVQMGEIAAPGTGADPGDLAVDRERILTALAAGYPKVLPDTRDLVTSRPKFPEPAGWLLTRLGISGIYFPFTGEASVNGQMPDVAIPFVAAHEMAHQKGIAREDEANAIAYLACRSAGLWATRYSGALSAYRRALGALYRADADSARAVAAAKLLQPGPEADRYAIQEFWRRHESTATHVATTANDTYLKANAQRAGVQSYGRMIDILVALDHLGMIGP
ncbi:MAG: DUF3810 domain-containing protein [Candidatus Eisenbacteria bacterium]